MALITLLHATRGRPKQAVETATEWWVARASGKHDLEYIVGLDGDDPDVATTIRYFKRESWPAFVTRRFIGGLPAINNAAWNRAYWASDKEAKLVVQVSDDFEAPHGWDVKCIRLLEEAGGLNEPLALGVGIPRCNVKGQAIPSYSGDGACHEIIIATRAYLEKIGGFLLYPEYLSMKSDDGFAMQALMNGCLVDAYQEICFCHHWHGAEADPLNDDTYRRHRHGPHWDVGLSVFGDQQAMLFPDVTLDGDPTRDILKDEWFVPPNIKNGPELARRRRQRGWARIQNLPFDPMDPAGRWYFYRGHFVEARERLTENIIKKYHHRAAGGNFLAHSACFAWNECTRAIGDWPKDADLPDTRDKDFWRELVK